MLALEIKDKKIVDKLPIRDKILIEHIMLISNPKKNFRFV